MPNTSKPSAAVLLTMAQALLAGACSGIDCPRGYGLRDDRCYRIRDAGEDGGDTAVGQAPSNDLEDAATEPAVAAPGTCADGCGAHASCDSENDVCKCDPGYLETSAGCVREACPQAGACDEPCNHASDCTDKMCQTKACASGRCVYTEVTPGEGSNCASGLVCTANLECKECISDEQCSHLDGTCAEGICDLRSNTCQPKPKTGACGNMKVCSEGSCVNSCGNGVVDSAAGEECDHTATQAGWDDWSCNSQTCRQTGLSSATSYHKCGGDADCTASETCKPTPAMPVIPLCIPKCFWGTCPFPPGYTAYIPRDGMRTLCDDAMGFECWIKCTTPDDCPPSLSCAGGACVNYD